MKGKKLRFYIGIAMVLIIIIIGIYLLVPKGDVDLAVETRKFPKLRIAWMTSWAGGGKVVEALIHTDILKRHDVNVEFKKFLFGPPMNEAALTGSVDVTIVGDMPAISLLAASDKWSVVSLTIYFPYALMVRNDLKADTIADLKGKTIGVPFGSGPQPTLYHWLEEEGLIIDTDVRVINILPNELAEAIRSKRVDAIMAWEPIMTILKKDNSAWVLREARGVGFMCMSNEFIEDHPEVVARFIDAWKEALLFSAQNKLQTVEWFSVDSRIPVDILANISIVDENLRAERLEDIDVRLTEEDVAKNKRKADFAFQQKLISKPLDLMKRVRWEFMTNLEL